MSDKKTHTHTLNLNKGARAQLSQILGAPGLLTETADVYRAGKISEDHFLDVDMGPKVDPSDKESVKASGVWQRELAEPITISERERDTAKKAVTAAIGKGIVFAGPASLCLLRELGLAPEE